MNSIKMHHRGSSSIHAALFPARPLQGTSNQTLQTSDRCSITHLVPVADVNKRKTTGADMRPTEQQVDQSSVPEQLQVTGMRHAGVLQRLNYA